MAPPQSISERQAALREMLDRNGWQVELAEDGSLFATIEGLVSQVDARQRLHEIGLLTSSKLRIDFTALRETTRAGESRLIKGPCARINFVQAER
jgi:hypothetical protein